MDTRLHVLSLPCAGASATMYMRWGRLLPDWIRIIPVELPGRGRRLGEPLAEDFDALVARLCEEQAALLAGPHVLFGHSMGALLAYGMATRQRQHGGRPPRALLVSGSPAPSRRDPLRFACKDGDDDALITDLRRQGGTPDAVFASPELLRMTLDTLAADYKVCDSFRYAGPAALQVPVHAFAGRHDEIAPDRVEAWGAEAGAGFTLDWFDGGHFFLRQHEALFLGVFVRRLVACLDPFRHLPTALA